MTEKLKISHTTHLTGAIEDMVIDGVSIRLNFSGKKTPNAFDNIRKTLLQSHQMGKKIARIQ